MEKVQLFEAKARLSELVDRAEAGKLAVLSGKEVSKILARYGFDEVRRRGSHVVMQRRSPSGTTAVPVNAIR